MVFFFSSVNLFVFPEVFSCLVFYVLSTMNPKLRHWLFYQFPLLIEFLPENFFCPHLDWSTPQPNFHTASWRTPLSLSCVGSTFTCSCHLDWHLALSQSGPGYVSDPILRLTRLETPVCLLGGSLDLPKACLMGSTYFSSFVNDTSAHKSTCCSSDVL